MSRSYIPLIALSLVACTPPPAHTTTPEPAVANHPCATAAAETLMEIQTLENDGVSICRHDGVGDCLYSAEAGRTFEVGRPDLNYDGHPDFLIRDFTGAYGNHDVIHFLGYAACPAGGYVKVLDSFMTSVEPTDDTSSGWREISASRDCFDDSTQDVVSRRYRLTWDERALTYGPPDNDEDLAQYCSSKEMAPPPNSPHFSR